MNADSGFRLWQGALLCLLLASRGFPAERVQEAAQISGLPTASTNAPARLKALEYNNPGLVVDLGVGLWAWPLPMDFDQDGDNDLVVVSPDEPFNGTYFFENTEGDVKQPVFAPPVRISKGAQNVQVSYVDGMPRVLSPGIEHYEFFSHGIDSGIALPVADEDVFVARGRSRAKQWKYLDYDGDGIQDLVAGYDEWADYGWDNAYDEQGNWTNGPLRGYVLWLRNRGSNARPDYGKPRFVMAAGKPVEVFGWPSPNFADFDGDGDLDLICGEFLDTFTYFQNVGSRQQPAYAAGVKLLRGEAPLRMDVQMIVPVAFDWDKDGDIDLVTGDEDGRVALVEHSGRVEAGVPVFYDPVYFQQKAQYLKFGALSTPHVVDWDGDGDEDILSGNTAGYIGFFENLGGGEAPVWNRARRLEADGQVIRIQAGSRGSIQGPAEAKWGYTTLTVADWNQDGLLDIVANSIWGKVIWYQNIGTATAPVLTAAQPIEVDWPGAPPKPRWNWWHPVGKALVSQWRTTPVATDWNDDGLTDLVMLDHEGQLALFERRKTDAGLTLLPGRRIFRNAVGGDLDLVWGPAGKSGRRKLAVVDWDGDGRLDMLFNSVNADFYRNIGERNGRVLLENQGAIDGRKVSGHTASPTTVDWDGNGIPDLLVGAEDGRFYYARNPRAVGAVMETQ
ncbi:MAG: VCBS repeat-containing protein [Halieaceae bacterium]|jgi:hypothetical protein|nr:VCBS repeat-containing protein [Halieaceae bacterium]